MYWKECKQICKHSPIQLQIFELSIQYMKYATHKHKHEYEHKYEYKYTSKLTPGCQRKYSISNKNVETRVYIYIHIYYIYIYLFTYLFIFMKYVHTYSVIYTSICMYIHIGSIEPQKGATLVASGQDRSRAELPAVGRRSMGFPRELRTATPSNRGWGSPGNSGQPHQAIAAGANTYIYVCIYIYIYMYTYTYVYAYICIHIHTSVYKCIPSAPSRYMIPTLWPKVCV